MERTTKEITVKLRPDDIVEIKTNEGITELKMEYVENNIATINEVYHSREGFNAALLHMPSFYVKKNVLKRYAANTGAEAVAIAMLTHSFASQIIGNLMLTLRGRILALSNQKIEPSKVFRDKEAAEKWLLEHLERARQ